YTIRPGQPPEIGAYHSAGEVGLLRIVDGNLDYDRSPGSRNCERLFEDRLGVIIIAQCQVPDADSAANRGEVVVGKLGASLPSECDLLKLGNLRQLAVAQDQNHHRKIELPRGEQFETGH